MFYFKFFSGEIFFCWILRVFKFGFRNPSIFPGVGISRDTLTQVLRFFNRREKYFFLKAEWSTSRVSELVSQPGQNHLVSRMTHKLKYNY